MTVSRLARVAALVGLLPPLPGELVAVQQITPRDSATDSVAIATAKQGVTSGLAEVTLAQAAYHKAYGTYAASLRQLQLASSFTMPSGVSLIVLSSTTDGWSAIAADSLIPEVRCATFSGKAKPPFEDRLPDSDVSCRSTGYHSKPRADSLSSLITTQRPQQLRCEVRHLPFHLQHPGRVTLQFVLDKDGHPEPTSVRFLTSPDLLDDLSALVVLSGCMYRPAQVDDKPVRVLIQQPIDLHE